MKGTDLRIGNLIEIDNQIVTVGGVIVGSVLVLTNKESAIFDCIPITNVKPIPLTEEWLLKFGYEKYYYYYDNKADFRIRKSKNHYIAYFSFNDINYTLCELKHIHHLQNLYHSLTGKELKHEK